MTGKAGDPGETTSLGVGREVDAPGVFTDLFVRDEDFNEAVRSLHGNLTHIQARLAELQADSPLRASLQEIVIAELRPGWPGEIETTADFDWLVGEVDRLCADGAGAIEDLQINTDAADLGAISAFGLMLAGVVTPGVTIGVATVGATGTLIASSRAGRIREVNDKADVIVRLSQSLASARLEFDKAHAAS